MTFTQDAFGRVLTSTTGGDTATFTWDGNGNLCTATPPAGSEHDQTFTYLNQLLAPTIASRPGWVRSTASAPNRRRATGSMARPT